MQRSLGFMLTAVAIAVLYAAPSSADERSSFERLTGHYEGIRQALLHDSMDGVADAAHHIEHELDALESEFTASTAGIRPGSDDDCRAVLPAIRSATTDLLGAATIADARESFGDLSNALVQFRQLVAEPAPVVAFCSMAQKVWLQPKGEIGNPYYGQSMARCGEIVSE